MIRVSLTENGAYWQARWTDDGRPKGKGLGNRAKISREAAEARCREIERDLNERGANITAPLTLDVWLETFLGLRPNLSEKSEKLYRACAGRLGEFLGCPNAVLRSITTLDAMAFRAWLSKHENLGQQTVFRIMVEARAIFQQAADTDQLPKNPFAKAVPNKPRADRTWHYVGLDALEKLLGVSPMPWRAFLGLTRLAGLRQHEALGLKWQNVDLIGRRLTVVHPGQYETTKGRTRQVPIMPRLHDLLFETSMESAGGEYRVCQGLVLGSLHREFQALCAKAGLEPWAKPSHMLRRGCETDWAGRFPLHVVTDWLGNSPAVALSRYTKATESDFRAASANATGAPARSAEKTDSTPVPGQIEHPGAS